MKALLLLILAQGFASPAAAISSSNYDVKLVTQVFDYGKYIERWSYVYPPGDRIKVYAGVSDINHNRAYAVDFIAVVYDPNGYVIWGKIISKEGLDYTDRVYAVFDIPIEDSWLPGKYRIDVYAFDVLNSSATYSRYNQLAEDLIYQGKFDPRIYKISREEADYIKKTVYVEIKSAASKYPPDRFIIFDARLKAVELPENVNNTFSLTALNTVSAKGKLKISVAVDGDVIETQNVDIPGNSYKVVDFTIPPLPLGEHRIEVITSATKARTPPIFVEPLLFKGNILMGKNNGSVVYFPNNYILGSVGISELVNPNEDELQNMIERTFSAEYDANRDAAANVITNTLAYLWKSYERKGDIHIALLKGSDERAASILPRLLDYVKKKSGAPIVYLGERSVDKLDGVDVLFYVSSSPPPQKISDYIKKGGFLIVDRTSFWANPVKDIQRRTGVKLSSIPQEFYTSFFDLNINKTIVIKLKTELKLPPEPVYYDLQISDFLVEPNQTVTISFKVRNDGGLGKIHIPVYINDKEVFNTTKELGTGDVAEISFNYTPKTEGIYRVTIDQSNTGKAFFVKKTEEKTITPEKTPEEKKVKERKGGGLVLAIGSVLALLIILRIYLKG